MLSPQKRQSRTRRSSRRSGSVIVYTAASMIAFLGVAALSVDMGFLYTRRAEAQRASDAAALAGASTLFKRNPDPNDPTIDLGDFRTMKQRLDEATLVAQQYAALNGYGSANGATVDCTYPPAPVGDAAHIYLRVKVSRPEPAFFGRIFTRSSTRLVEAASVALNQEAKVMPASIPISGVGSYGIASGPINLSMFGPYGYYEFGDPFSTKYINMINQPAPLRPNPAYVPDAGITFDLNLNANYVTKYGNDAQVEIFDPGTYNKGGNPDALTDERIDEIRPGWPGRDRDETTTRYELLSYQYNANDTFARDGLQVEQSKTYPGGDPTADMAWDPAFNFTVDPSRRYLIKAVTIDGSSENGFSLRAGPPHKQMDDKDWNKQYADSTTILAQGRLPINFNSGGNIRVGLGYVPPEARNGSVSINKFDTDIGGSGLRYECDGWKTFPGTIAGNGQWVEDTIKLPADYPGGNWFAVYTAQAQDSSAWVMKYQGPDIPKPPGGHEFVSLVQ